MPTLFPADPDTFRLYLALFDDMIALDFNDFFDVVVGIENELGINPSGSVGTIYSRLFGTRNISEVFGVWQRFAYNAGPIGAGSSFDRSQTAFQRQFSPGRYEGPRNETIFGVSVPGVFAALQDTFISSVGGSNFARAPWRHLIHNIESSIRRNAYGFYARTGDNNECTAALSPDSVKFNLLEWNAFT